MVQILCDRAVALKLVLSSGFFRAMTMGEIGCFLSHYYIWEEVRGHTVVVNSTCTSTVHLVKIAREHTAHVY